MSGQKQNYIEILLKSITFVLLLYLHIQFWLWTWTHIYNKQTFYKFIYVFTQYLCV